MSRGIIYEWTRANGDQARGVALYEDQDNEFKGKGLLFIRILDADGNIKIEKGVQVATLKAFQKLKRIGFQD